MYRPVYGPENSARLSTFHELDLRLDKTFTFDRWRFAFYLDLMNVYNRANPEGYAYNFNYTQRQPVSGLPILPVVGLRGEF